MDKTLIEKLREYASSAALPMHMPGHKRRGDKFPWLEDLGCGVDITEIDGFDNLNDPEGPFKELNNKIAELWGAERSFPLVNGSTGGILAAVKTALPTGGEILMFRGCHKSVYNAAELCGARTRYLVPKIDRRFGIWGSAEPSDVENSLKELPDVRLVVITSPTYEGVISDVSAIAEVCHERGVPLLVDEAHGAHLGFGGFSKSAVSCGADMVVQSLHKTLPSLTQTAVLHVCGDLIDMDTAARNVAIFQSSSPSYLLSSGIDGCVRYMQKEGNTAAEQWLCALSKFDVAINGLHALKVLCHGDDTAEKHEFFNFDPSKIVISTAGTGISGNVLLECLRREYKIELEMAVGDYAIAMTGMGDDDNSLLRLASALCEIDSTLSKNAAASVHDTGFSLPESVMTAGEAEPTQKIGLPLDLAEGRISAEYVWTYPPGAPIIIPGERVLWEQLDTILSLKESGLSVRSTYGELPQRLFCVEKCY